MKHKNVHGAIWLDDKTYVINPHYIDYEEGEGWRLAGGELYDNNGRHLGHCDPPGYRGFSGLSGYSGYENINSL